MVTRATAVSAYTSSIIGVVLCVYVAIDVEIATVTGVCCISALSTGRRSYFNRSMAVTCRVYIRVNIEIFAVAGVGGVALLGTSRRGYYGSVGMTVSSYALCFGVIAVNAIMLPNAFVNTGGFQGDIPFSIAMTCCTYICVNIRVITVTSMSGVSTLCTVGRGYYRSVGMSCCVYVCIFIRVIAVRTSVRGVALFRTSGICNNGAIAVSERIDYSVLAFEYFIAGAAVYVFRITGIGTSRRYVRGGYVVMRNRES